MLCMPIFSVEIRWRRQHSGQQRQLGVGIAGTVEWKVPYYYRSVGPERLNEGGLVVQSGHTDRRRGAWD